MLDPKTKERIAKEAREYWLNTKGDQGELDYIAGAEAEAIRADGLVEFLINLRKHPRVTNQMEEMITEALNQYNKPDK